MDTDHKKRSVDWAGIVLVLTVAYVLALWSAHDTMRATPGEWAEHLKMNFLGDTLSGLFAPLAFLWLAAAVLIQRQELALTRGEFAASRKVMDKQAAAAEEQTRIALASARANYQLALFEKRIHVYNQLNDIAYELHTEGSVTRELQRRIRDTAETARFVFGDDVSGWLADVSNKSFNALRKQLRIDRLVAKANERMLKKEEVETQHKLIDEVHEIETQLYDDLSSKKIEAMIEPHLRLPVAIEIERDGNA